MTPTEAQKLVDRGVSTWDVFQRMTDADDAELKMAPMDNVLTVTLTKFGTKVTIGVGEDIVTKIARSELMGGFIFCDKKHFDKIKAELAAERIKK